MQLTTDSPEGGSEVGPDKQKHVKRRVLFALKVLLSVGLLAYLATMVDLRDLLSQLLALDLRYLAVAVVIFFIQYALSTLKWQRLLRADGIVMPFGFLLRTYMIGVFLSLFLPTSFGGDVFRVMAVRGVNRDLARTTSSVLFDRLSGLFALVSIACIAYAFLPGSSWLPVVGLYVLGVGSFLALTTEPVVQRLEASSLSLLRKAGKLLRSFNTYTRVPSVLLTVLAISFLFQFNVVLVNKVYTLALGLEIPLAELSVIVPLVFLSEALPISINGLGVRESAFVFFFSLLGHGREEGLALALVVVCMRYLLGSVGGLVLVGTALNLWKQPKASEPQKP